MPATTTTRTVHRWILSARRDHSDQDVAGAIEVAVLVDALLIVSASYGNRMMMTNGTVHDALRLATLAVLGDGWTITSMTAETP